MELKLDIDDLQRIVSDFHYSDIRRSGHPVSDIVGFFPLYGHEIDFRLMKFGLNDPQVGTKDFHYPDI